MDYLRETRLLSLTTLSTDDVSLYRNAGIKAVTLNQSSKKTSTTQNAIEFCHHRSYNPRIQRQSGENLQ